MSRDFDRNASGVRLAWSVSVRRDPEQIPPALLVEVRAADGGEVRDRRQVADEWSLWEFLRNVSASGIFARSLFGATDRVDAGEAVRRLDRESGVRIHARAVWTARELRDRLDRLVSRTGPPELSEPLGQPRP